MRIPRPRRWLKRVRRVDTEERGSYSLFGEILDWMLAPLLFLWPISIILTYDVAAGIANKPYDLALADQVRALSRQVHFGDDGLARLDLPTSTSRLIRADTEDTIYYQVRSPDGQLLAGDTEIPPPDPDLPLDPETVRFRDDDVQGNDIRVAFLPVCKGPRANGVCATVQVAETLQKRNSLSSQIISGVMLPQAAIIPLALVLVWFGLSHGIAPLSRLQAAIRLRRPGDLSPVDPHSVPEEVRPLIIAFNDMMDRLEHNLEAQQRFIADAAHQMRTPLAGLRIQAELALRESDPALMHAALLKVLSGAERSARLINQLLALARVEASSEAIDAFGAVDLGGLLREVVGDLVPAALLKGIDIGLDGDEAIHLEGNPILLREAISNLVDNAIKYTPGGGRVTAKVGIDPESPDLALIVVEDDGPGIAAEARLRIFERFYRMLGSTVEGSGLGLSIVREVVELHAGTVTVEDAREHRGARFELRLPLQREKT